MASLPRLVKACDVIDLLKARYAPPAYAFLEQVANGTGGRATRWADGVAMSVWPSRGYGIEGFEVKVSRYDWLQELRNPAKAEAVMKYCHNWWLVVSDEKIVESGELPCTWGLMVVAGNKLKVMVPAPRQTPTPADIPFVASLMRNFVVSDENKVNEAYLRGKQEGRDEGRDYTATQLKSLTKSVSTFEELSGIKITSWDGPQLGGLLAAVKKIQWSQESLQRSKEAAQQVVEGLDALLQLTGVAEIVAALKTAAKAEEVA